MSESLAKLTIKVKLHPAVTVRPPEKAALSKAKIAIFVLGLLLLGSLSWFFIRPLLGHSQVSTDTAVEAVEAVEKVEKVEEVEAVEAEEVMAAEHMPASAQADTLKFTSSITPVAAATAQAEPQSVTNSSPAATTQNSAELTSQSAPAQQSLPAGFRRIVLTKQVRQLEPGPAVQQIVAKAEIQRLYLFTELSGYAGQQVRHRWWYRDQLQTDTLLTIEDSPWRTYSEKWLLPDQTGPWRVEIIDQEQNVLYQHDFQYQ